MEYMRVLQWPSSCPVDELDLLISLEEEIIENIGDCGIVDGHDIDSGEMNIFIFTGDPRAAFEQVKNIGSVLNYMSDLKVGYRVVGEDDFVPLYPKIGRAFFDNLEHTKRGRPQRERPLS